MYEVLLETLDEESVSATRRLTAPEPDGNFLIAAATHAQQAPPQIALYCYWALAAIDIIPHI